jgi:hypothetical protein
MGFRVVNKPLVMLRAPQGGQRIANKQKDTLVQQIVTTSTFSAKV